MTGIDSDTGEPVELLEFAPEIVEHTGFVTALAERVARFAAVRHASYVHLRRLDRPSADRLQLVSDLTPGWRLSEMVEESSAAGIPIDITVVIALLRQLLPAVALFGRHNRENAIGALSPHRLIVTPQARLVIAEHAFGPAIEKLNLGRDKLWRDFRVSMPPSAGLPRANPRADANAIGVVALTLVLGRALELDEFPTRLEALVEHAQQHRNGEAASISASFKNWLKRALQFDVASAFQSPSEAQLAFESVLASDRSYVTNSPAFASWVNEIGGTIDIKRRPAAPPPPLPPPPSPPPAPPERASEPELVILRSNGEVAGDTIAESAYAPEESDELEQEGDAASDVPGGPELISEPEPPPQPEEIAVVPEPVDEIVAPAYARDEPGEPVVIAAPDVAGEEIEIPLDDTEAATASVTTPEPVAEIEVEREPEPEAAPVHRPRAAFTREQLEEDPIARALLMYQPKADPVPAPVQQPDPVPEPLPERAAEVVEEPGPAAAVVEEPAPAVDVVEGPEPAAEVVEEIVEEPQAIEEPAPPIDAQAPPYEATPVAEDDEKEEESARYEPPPPAQYTPPPPPSQYNPYAAAPAPEAYDEPEPPQASAYDATSDTDTPRYKQAEEPAPPAAPASKDTYEDDEPKKGSFSNPVVLGLAGVVVLLVAVMGWMLTRPADTGGMRQGEGELVVQSRPEGAQVKIDGAVKGSTPLTVRLDAGAHVMEVQSGNSEPRVIPLTITAGVQTSQYVELQGVAKTGSLQIRSEPPGARITIDGRQRGTAPMTVGDLSPGDHTVVLEAGGRKASQTVRIQAGTTQQLVVPMRR
jgi:hypothetical protein